MKTKLYGFGAMLLFCCTNYCWANEMSAVNVVQHFYERYFHYTFQKIPNVAAPQIAFSQAFKRELNINKTLCSPHADEVCGFGSDGDPYLNTQDFDDDLTIQKAKLNVTQEKNGLVKVRFFLFPSQDYPPSIVKYKMIKEDNKWVVDDIIYLGGITARRLVQEENDSLKKDPENAKLLEKNQ